MTHYDVAVVGLGAMGSSALRHLALRGRRVIGLERATPGHAGGSSHGESRIIRLAYFEHPSYVPLVRRAYEGWRALERASGRTILTVTGILEAGTPGSEIVEGSLASSRLHDIPHEQLSARAISQRFPAFTLPDGWEGVFQPDAGILRPELAISLQVEAAVAAGAEIRTDAVVRAIEPRGGGVRVTLADGSAIQAGSAIVAAGPWIAELVPELAPALTLTRQVMAWFKPVQPALTTTAAFPVFLLQTETDAVYGFPDFAGTGVKAASHQPGRRLASAGDARQDATLAEVRPIQAVLERCIPAAAGPVAAMRTCIYTHAPDEDFIVDLHPRHPEIVIASACSGHGFKFASIMGEALADLAVSGSTDLDISRFRMARLGDVDFTDRQGVVPSIQP